MKILHIMIACFYVEGMEYQENVLPRKHKKNGFDVEIVTTQFSFDRNGKKYLRNVETYENKDGIRVNVLGYKRGGCLFYLLGLKRINGLYEKIKSYKPDIIFVHGCQFYDIKDVIRYKKKCNFVKIYVDNHTDFINTPVDTWKRKLYYKIVIGSFARWISNYAEKFWGVTPSRIEYIKSVYGVQSDNLDLLVMGGDEDKFNYLKREECRKEICATCKFDSDDFIIITGGKIDERKKIHLLIQIATQLPLKCKILIFGNPNSEIEKYFQNLPSNVFHLGWIDSDKAYKYFVASDLGVFPGTHSVLWEQAVATGLPCVFRHWDGMEHVDVGGNAILLDGAPDDDYKLSLQQSIIGLADRGIKYTQMKNIALDKAMKVFSYKNIALRAIEMEDYEKTK